MDLIKETKAVIRKHPIGRLAQVLSVADWTAGKTDCKNLVHW